MRKWNCSRRRSNGRHGVIHLNGTSREALVEQRCQVGLKLQEALEAFGQMAPNGRDYYPQPGLMEKAVAQQERRVATLRSLLREIEEEAQAIVDL